jgi:hypothetical protein
VCNSIEHKSKAQRTDEDKDYPAKPTTQPQIPVHNATTAQRQSAQACTQTLNSHHSDTERGPECAEFAALAEGLHLSHSCALDTWFLSAFRLKVFGNAWFGGFYHIALVFHNGKLFTENENSPPG